MPRQRKWLPLEQGEFKANFDGAMFNKSDKVGVEVVIKDSMGQIIAAMAEKIRKPHSVECLEMFAARRAVTFASKIGLQQFHFKGDSEISAKALKICFFFVLWPSSERHFNSF